MSSTLQLSYLTTTQPNIGGTNVKIVTTQKMTSFSYIIFPGDNATYATYGTEYSNSLVNRSVNVGGDDCTLIDEDNDGYETTYTYILFVNWCETVCTYTDYFVVVSGLELSSGLYTEYTEPVPLYLSPEAIDLSANDVFITRTGYNYTDATITILFDEPTCFRLLYDISYNVAVQYIDGDGQTVFITQETSYVDDLFNDKGGVSIELSETSGVTEDTFVAIQAIRNIAGAVTQKAIGEISNTVRATDTEKSLPPRNLTLIDYVYFAEPPFAILEWEIPSTYPYINVDEYNVYRRVDQGAYELYSSVPVTDPEQVIYEFIDLSLNDFESDTLITYYVTAVNEDGSSGPSNPVSLTITVPSSDPRNLQATGLTEPVTDEGDVLATFSNPAIVSGEVVCGYDTAFFRVEVFDLSNNLLGSSNVDYEPDDEKVYLVAVSGFPVPVSDITDYTVKVTSRLITYKDDCEEILGNIADVTITIGPAPFVYNINGNGISPEGLTWPAIGYGLQTFDVATYSPLLVRSTRVLHYIDDTRLIRWLTLEAESETVAGSSDPFPGAIIYHFVNREISSRAIALSTSNAYGAATVSAIGQIL